MLNKPVIFLGDIHGNYNNIVEYILRRNISDVIIYQVGDFGIGFNKQENEINRLNDLNKFLLERNIHLFAIRGNHDDPDYFNGMIETNFTNVKLLPDYSVITVNGKNILGIGGGISIDRSYRKQVDRQQIKYGSTRRSYWRDEVVVYDENKLVDLPKIDILVTHTTVDFCQPINDGVYWPPIVKQFMIDDPNLGRDLMLERGVMTNIYNKIKEKNEITHHFYGHFHDHYERDVDGTRHICLDCNEFYPLSDYDSYEHDLTKFYSEN